MSEKSHMNREIEDYQIGNQIMIDHGLYTLDRPSHEDAYRDYNIQIYIDPTDHLYFIHTPCNNTLNVKFEYITDGLFSEYQIYVKCHECKDFGEEWKRYRRIMINDRR